MTLRDLPSRRNLDAPGDGPGGRFRRRPGGARAAVLAGLLLAGALLSPRPAGALEICEPKAKELMRSVGITERQIEALCDKAELASRLTRLSIRRTEDEVGYCRVTLALRNDSVHPIDSFILTTADSRFELFRFYEVLPGQTGYASARSRSLLACDELPRLGLQLNWPPAVRVAGRSLRGPRLENFRPALMSEVLQWSR